MNAQGLCVARSLGRQSIPVVGMDHHSTRVGCCSRYAKFLLMPDLAAHPEAWVERLIAEGRRLTQPGVLFPCNDTSVLLVSTHRTVLEPWFRIRLPASDIVELLLNKRLTMERAASLGVAAPRAVVLDGPEALGRVEREIGFPCAIKPVHSHLWRRALGSERKLIPVHSPQELMAQWSALRSSGLELLAIELIPGHDTQLYSLYTYLREDGSPLYLYTKRKLRQFPVHHGIGSLHEGINRPDVAALGLFLLKGVGHRGFAHVEFKEDPRDGRLKLIEVNPRCTVALQLVVASGIDAPSLAYRETLGERISLQPPRTHRKKLLFFEQDYEAFRSHQREGQLSWRRWLMSLWGTNVFGIFAWDDPWPFVRSLGQRARSAMERRLRSSGGDSANGRSGRRSVSRRRHMPRLLITDAHTKQALAITQSLGRRGIEVSLVDSSTTAPAFASQYCCEQLIAPDRRDERAYIEFLLHAVRRRQYELLITCDDLTTWYVSRARSRLAPHVRIILPDAVSLETAMYKDRLAAFALEHGIPVARTFFPTNMEEVREFSKQLPGPIVVKGVRGSGSKQIRYATHDTVEQAVQEVRAFGPSFNPRWPILQEYIPGENKTVYVLCDRGNVLAFCPFETLRSYPVWGGVPSIARAIDDKELERLTRLVAERIGWHGIAGIAFRLDHRDGRYKLLEINVRFGGTTQVAVAAGVDLPYLLWSHFIEGEARGQTRPRPGTVHRSLLPDEVLHIMARPTSIGRVIADTLTVKADYGLKHVPLRVIARQLRSTWWEVRAQLRARALRQSNGTIPMPALPVVRAAARPGTPTSPRRTRLRRWLKVCLAHAALWTGVLALVRWLAGQRQDRFGILMYHRVGSHGLSAAVFAKQLRYLAQHYRVMPLERVVRYHVSGAPLPRGTVALTFDDGYADFAEVAAPMLKRQQLPATVFPITGGMESREPLWTAVVSAVCRHLGAEILEVPLGLTTLRYSLRTGAARQAVADDLKRRLKHVDADVNDAMLEELKARCPAWRRLAWEEAPLLDGAQLAALRRDGIDIGAHTVHHPILSRVTLERAALEIQESKRQLEERLGESIRLFCYPNGTREDYHPAISQLVQDAGYEAACTTESGWNNGATSRWALRRFPTSEPSLAVFACDVEELFKPANCLQAVRAGWAATVRKLARLARDGSLAALQSLIAERLWITRRGVVMTIPAHTPLRRSHARLRCESGWATPGDRFQLPSLVPGLTTRIIERRYAVGDRCWVARRGERIVSFLWVGRHAPDVWYVRGAIPLKAGHVYIYNAFTVKGARGLGAFPQSLEALRGVLRSEGVSWLDAFVDEDNAVSIRTFRAFGACGSGRVSLTRRIGWTRRRVGFVGERSERSEHRRYVPRRAMREDWAFRHAQMPPVLVLGQGRTGLGADRLLGRLGVRVIRVDDNSAALGFRSRYGTPRCIEAGDTEKLIQLCLELRRATHMDPVLMPTSDHAVRWIAGAWQRLAPVARYLGPSPELAEALLDKSQCAALAADVGLEVPHTARAESASLVAEATRLGFPCVIKPDNGHVVPGWNGDKVLEAAGAEDVRRLLERLNGRSTRWTLQELIPGDDGAHWSCAACLDPQGNVLGVFTSRKIRQYPPRHGISTICESRWNSELAERSVRFLQAIGYRGVAELEFKQDARDGRSRLIEVNPRLWMQHSLAARCGVNLTDAAYAAAAGLDVEPLPRQRDGVRWVAADLDWMSLRRSALPITWSDRLEGFRGEREWALWTWDDARPALHQAKQLWRARAQKRQAATMASHR